MAKTRISAHIRDSILANARIKGGYSQRIEDQIRKRAALAEELYQLMWSFAPMDAGEALKVREQANALLATTQCSDASGYGRILGGHASGLGKCSHIELRVDRCTHYFFFNGSANHEGTVMGSVNDEGNRRIEMYTWPRLEDNVKADFVFRLNVIEDEITEINDEWEGNVPTILAAIKRFGTVEQLVEKWPEGKELLPEKLRIAKPTGVAISIADLNAICGVPTGK